MPFKKSRKTFPTKKELEETLGKPSKTIGPLKIPLKIPALNTKTLPWIVSIVLLIALVSMIMTKPTQVGFLTPSENITYFWDFGDGTIGTGLNPAHTYDKPGNYTITLITTNGTAAVHTTFEVEAGKESSFFIVSPIANVTSESALACFDGIDNDGNGLVDSQDPGCYFVEICTDGKDNDLDRLIDYDDPDCFRREIEDQCYNNMDDDRDGVADCWDSDCKCAEKGLEAEDVCHINCDDELDNDGDGLIDCDDPGCQGSGICEEQE